MPQKPTLQEKVDAAKELVKTFHKERIAFLIIAIISFSVLLGLAIYTFLNKEMGWKTFSALFLPAGGITYSASQILTMFTKCMKFLE